MVALLMTKCDVELMMAEILVVIAVTNFLTLVGLIFILARKPKALDKPGFLNH